jgi:hypothetical protein
MSRKRFCSETEHGGVAGSRGGLGAKVDGDQFCCNLGIAGQTFLAGAGIRRLNAAAGLYRLTELCATLTKDLVESMGAGQFNQSAYQSFSSQSDYCNASDPLGHRIEEKLTDWPGRSYGLRNDTTRGQTSAGPAAFLLLTYSYTTYYHTPHPRTETGDNASGIYIASRIPVKQPTFWGEIRTEQGKNLWNRTKTSFTIGRF